MNGAKKTAMALSAVGLLAIAGFEGYRGEAYQPLPGDVWTIGFGHTKGVIPGDTLTPREALSILYKDAAHAQDTVNRSVNVPLKQYEFDALVSLTYNIGSGAFSTSTLLKCLNQGDKSCVQSQWMRWKYFHKKPNKGLESRRAKELFVFNGGEVRKDPDGRICFGSAGCVTNYAFLQERSAGPDGAEEGDGGTVLSGEQRTPDSTR